MDKVSKLGLPIGILVSSLILGGFYYASQVNKSSSIEKQQQFEQEAITDRTNADLQAKEEARQATTEQNNLVAQQKAACAKEAQQIAVKVYKDYCSQTHPCPPAQPSTQPGMTNLSGFCPQSQIDYCPNYKEGQYRTEQYDSAYSACLQRKGLK